MTRDWSCATTSILALVCLACVPEAPDDERTSAGSVGGLEGGSSPTSAGLDDTGDTGDTSDTSNDTDPSTGDPSETDTGEDPVPVTVAIAAGHTNTCALASDGRVKCWGHGIYGTNGQGDTRDIGDDESPDSVHAIDLGGPALEVSVGSGHACALIDGGKVRCWGYGGYGALGYANIDTIGDDETPASAGDINIGGTVVQITTGEMHTCARLDTGAVRCWGYLDTGLMIGDDETPASAGDVDLGGLATWISAGRTHTCAVLEGGSVRCWGNSYGGALGYGNLEDIGDDETPASAGDVPVGALAAQVEVAYAHSCALSPSGEVRCWGENQNGALGYGHTQNIGDDEAPATAGPVSVGGTVVELALGYNGFTCARLVGDGLRCWGSNYFGALGLGHTQNIGDDELPSSASLVEIGGPVLDVSAGNNHACAVIATGASDSVVRCWGDGQYGQLGYGNLDRVGDDEVPGSLLPVAIW